jgi:hypothetical protein
MLSLVEKRVETVHAKQLAAHKAKLAALGID